MLREKSTIDQIGSNQGQSSKDGCTEIDQVEDSAGFLVVICFIIAWHCEKESFDKYTREEGILVVAKEVHSSEQNCCNELLRGLVQQRKASLPI